MGTKPQQFAEALREYATKLGQHGCIISVAAGVRISDIQEQFKQATGITTGAAVPVIRAMPNINCLVGEGVTAFASHNTNPDHKEFFSELFGKSGKTLRVQEAQLNAVTAMSGSGPAYIIRVLESFVKAGIAIGFTEKESFELALQTIIGTGKLIEEKLSGHENGGVLDALRKIEDSVKSKGGTTEAAFAASFNDGRIEAVFKEGIEAANERGNILAKIALSPQQTTSTPRAHDQDELKRVMFAGVPESQLSSQNKPSNTTVTGVKISLSKEEDKHGGKGR